MEVEEFIEKFNFAPLDNDELAIVAVEVKGTLGEAARKLLEAQRAFDSELEEIGFEKG